jgi:hypothetical protein
VLLLVPIAQAGGSTVPLTHLALECLGLWVGLVLLMAHQLHGKTWAISTMWTNLAVLSVTVAAVSGSTTLLTPFGTSGYGDDTVAVPALGLKVSRESAEEYTALAEAVRPFVVRGKTPMVTLDRKAGLTYLLGGVQLGSAWTDAETLRRTGQLVALDCRRRGEPHLAPVLLVDRPVDDALVRALGSCGTAFPSDYRRLRVPGGPNDVTVFVPRK